MKALIYKTESFDSMFNRVAMNHTSKLSFTTKEEYLTWRKQWKEDYNKIVVLHKAESLYWKMTSCRVPEKVEYYTKKHNAIQPIADAIKKDDVFMSRYRKYESEIREFYGWGPYWTISSYVMVVYMLIVRKAGKIRANTQWNMQRLAKPQLMGVTE